jgi:hypothetical protein
MSLPTLPPVRLLDGATGTAIKETRDFLSALKQIALLNGKEVTITYTAADVAGSVIKRVITGLGYVPTGFFIVSGHQFSGLKQLPAPSTELDNSVLYLQANAASTYKLWVY